jgi:sorbitol-6-phosphate 2-dehydrogenase
MTRTLEDKVAVITGGAQGLGEALSFHLAKEGAHIVIADLNAEGAQETAAAIEEKTDRQALAVKVNITKEDEVEALFAKTVEKFGRVDILVSNAGVLVSGPIEEFDPDRWRFVLEVNLVGYMICAKHAIKQMLKQGEGVIVQINSKSGKKGSFKNSAYAASKFGGIGLTQSIALEMAERGIRVNAVCPGNLLDSPLWVDSLYEQYAENQGITPEEVRQKYVDKVPMKRGCTYEDVGNAVVFLASDKASYITGQAINVTGGQQLD